MRSRALTALALTVMAFGVAASSVAYARPESGSEITSRVSCTASPLKPTYAHNGDDHWSIAGQVQIDGCGNTDHIIDVYVWYHEEGANFNSLMGRFSYSRVSNDSYQSDYVGVNCKVGNRTEFRSYVVINKDTRVTNAPPGRLGEPVYLC